MRKMRVLLLCIMFLLCINIALGGGYIEGKLGSVKRNYPGFEVVVGGLSNISVEFSGVLDVEFHGMGKRLVKLSHDFDKGNLSITDIVIKKNRPGFNYAWFLLSGLKLQENEAIVYLDKVSKSNKVCIASGVEDINDVSDDCMSGGEVLVECLNETQEEDPECLDLGSQYSVSIPSDKGVKELLLPEDEIVEEVTEETTEEACVEDWECGEWEECDPSSIHIRKCVDNNNCGTSKQRPIEMESCEYVMPVMTSVVTTIQTTVEITGEESPESQAELETTEETTTVETTVKPYYEEPASVEEGTNILLFVIPLVVILLGGSVGFIYYQQHKSAAELVKEQHATVISQSTYNSLKQYIQREVGYGYTSIQIFNQLKKEGWKQSVINKLFTDIHMGKLQVPKSVAKLAGGSRKLTSSAIKSAIKATKGRKRKVSRRGASALSKLKGVTKKGVSKKGAISKLTKLRRSKKK